MFLPAGVSSGGKIIARPFSTQKHPTRFCELPLFGIFRPLFGVERRIKHGLDLRITQVKGNNHSAHTSKETQEYLNRLPGHLECVYSQTWIMVKHD